MTIQKYSTSILPTYEYPLDSRFKTVISEFDDGKEQRNRQWRFPRRIFRLNYKWLTQAQRNTLHDFFRDRYGANGEFWFIDFQSRDWDDEFLGYGGPLDLKADLYYKGGAYTNQTEESIDATTDDVYLVPATNSTAGDAVIFVSDEIFDRVKITITTAASHGCTGKWRFYSSTGGWADATVVTDETNSFTATTGTRNVDITPSTNWIDYEINGINGYALGFFITTTSSANVQAKASQVNTYSKYFAVPGLMTSSTSLSIYQSGISTTVSSITSGSAYGGADVLVLPTYPSSGALMTCDFTGYLRMKSRMDDTFTEEIPYKDKYDVAIDLTEIK